MIVIISLNKAYNYFFIKFYLLKYLIVLVKE